MREFIILGKRHKNKKIQVAKYATHTLGVEIEVTHNVPTEAGKSLRWVQTVTANNVWSITCGATRVDPFGFGTPSIHQFVAPGAPLSACKADDLKPFFGPMRSSAVGVAQASTTDLGPRLRRGVGGGRSSSLHWSSLPGIMYIISSRFTGVRSEGVWPSPFSGDSPRDAR